MGKIYNAKSANQFHSEITNQEHLRRVGALARIFGEEIGKTEEAALAGNLHDFGKYSDRFQGVLRGTCQGIDHAFSGAAEVYQRLGLKDGCWRMCADGVSIVEAIAGHHSGLAGLPQIEEELEETWNDDYADCCPSGKMPSVRGKREFCQAEQAFAVDFPGYSFPNMVQRQYHPLKQVENMLDTRMLFSCLVDADYSISASDDDPDYLKKNSSLPLNAPEMLKKLEAYCAKLRNNSTADPAINVLRNEVYDKCGEAGEQSMGLFTLTAPTGVGKTMAMLHFALRHCAKHNLGRIIVVLPFLALAEQTEKEYLNIFPEILVDHSQREVAEERRELTARWDSPVIITTSVRFFESLFSESPGDCRKLHHIAGSVVLFDEAQSLPASLARPTVEAVNVLCKKYHCTMVFSTATQPDFSALPKTTWEPREILPGNSTLFHKMRRVRTYWNRDMTLEQVAGEMNRETNVCCIVNLRRHARTLFNILQGQRNGKDDLYFLTTDLCPAHRLEVVAEIKHRQKSGLPCIVVATQCIEAGVDLDFDVMYRALAPLEAIIQAAGRCNRNGKLTEGGKVVVFRPAEEGRLYPGDSYERAANVVHWLWADSPKPDISDLGQICTYYKKYFSENKTEAILADAIRKKDYCQTSRHYQLVQNAGVPLIVPWEGKIAIYQRICQAIQTGQVHYALLREAAPITISCFDTAVVQTYATQLILHRGKENMETGTYILNTGFESSYDSKTGFSPGDIVHENFMV